MRVDKGKPSGANRSEGTGVPSKVKQNIKQDDQITEKYTEDDNKISSHVRSGHPNRNTNKLHPTNAGGYKNR